MSDYAWQSAREKFDHETMPKLKQLGMKIGKESTANPKAKTVIELYALLYRSFDPLTAFRLEEAITDYEADGIVRAGESDK